jgi:methylenetetrahydrofolate dehydrogenase (NADP+) / methenyltetrahydrofolate cyclohydrolase
MAHVIGGSELAEELRRTIDGELTVLRASEVHPGLATVVIGSDPGAAAYERHISDLAAVLGYHYVCERLSADVEVADVFATVGKLNADPRITGILIMRPMPRHLPEADINNSLDPMKDIEAVHPENAGLLAQGRARFFPSTPASCFYLLDAYVRSKGGDPATYYSGKTLVVVGRSISVGKPAQWMGLERNATVIACHAHTARAGKLPEITRLADILIVGAGVPGLVTGDMVREGVIAVDVGFHVLKDEVTGKSRIAGDLDFESVAAKAEAISPVPGGIGPITDVWLIGDALLAAGLLARVGSDFIRAWNQPFEIGRGQ